MPPSEAKTLAPAGTERESSLGSDLRAFFSLAAPMIVSRAGLAAMSIADTLMVSRYKTEQLAYFSLADGTLGRVLDICAAFILGGLILVPRAYGAGCLAKCFAIWRRTLPPAVGFGCVGLLIGLFGRQLFRLGGESATLASGAGDVLGLLSLGYVPALLALGAAVFLEGIQRPTVVAVSVVGANILNIVLNWMLISGHGGLPALGARGSALSTTLVRCALAIALVGYAWWLGRTIGTLAEENPEAVRESRAAQWRLGYSAAAVSGVILTLGASLTLFAGWIGPVALATIAAVWSLNGPAVLVALGMADATGIQVASAAGRGADGRPALLGWMGLSVTSAVMLLALACWCFFPQELAALFTQNAKMHRALYAVIPVAGVVLLFDSMSFVMVGALRGLRDIAWTTMIEIGAMAMLTPLALWLAFRAGEGVRGLVLAAALAGAVRTALLVIRFVRVTQNRLWA